MAEAKTFWIITVTTHGWYITLDQCSSTWRLTKKKIQNYPLMVLHEGNQPIADRFNVQYIPRNMHTVFALLCFVVVIHWLIFPYPSGLLHWHCGNLTIAPVPAKQPWWIWMNTSCEFIMNDCITTTKQSTTKPCPYFLGYTVQRESNVESVPCHYAITYLHRHQNQTIYKEWATLLNLSISDTNDYLQNLIMFV